MHPKSGTRRRHSDEFKANVVAACDAPGASISRNLVEMTAERGVLGDHATAHRWALKIVAGAGQGLSQPQAPGGLVVAGG